MDLYTQTARVKDYILANGEISQREAYRLGIYRLSGRIFDLKKRGENIITEMRKVENADGTTTRVAYYKMEGK